MNKKTENFKEAIEIAKMFSKTINGYKPENAIDGCVMLIGMLVTNYFKEENRNELCEEICKNIKKFSDMVAIEFDIKKKREKENA